MAVYSDTAGEWLSPGASVAPASHYPLTLMAWFYNDTAVETHYLLFIGDSGGNYCNYIGMADGTDLVLTARQGSSDAGSVPALDTWFHVAMVIDATNITLFYNGVQDAQTAKDTITTPYWIAFGDDTESRTRNGRMAYCRVFTAALNATQIAAEKDSAVAIESGCWGDWKLSTASDLSDYSGNGRTLTLNSGTLTTADGPSGVTEPPTGGTPGSIVTTITL